MNNPLDPARLPFRVGVSPLAWTNDVLLDLGGDLPLEQCLREARTAGYAGTELGRLFPRNAQALSACLRPFDLQLASGWHSGFLADDTVDAELERVEAHATLLRTMGAKVMVYGECGGMYGDRPLDTGMSRRPPLPKAAVRAYADRLTAFGEALQTRWGLSLAYHHHLMMVAETFDEISEVFDHAGAACGLLLDTGHAAAAGFDYAQLLARFGQRITHIHLKDVRADVMRQVRSDDFSFNEGVRAGMFTVPGDGCVDFAPLATFVQETGYSGWLIVEAEQDPVKAPPLATVTRARAFVADTFERLESPSGRRA